jgi:L-asparagine transporter-like permease
VRPAPDKETERGVAKAGAKSSPSTEKKSEAFEYLTSAVTFIGILVWMAILYTHWRFRQAQEAAGQPLPEWHMPVWPFSGVFAAVFLACIVAILVCAEATRVTVWVGLVLLAIISVGYLLTGREARAR